MGYKIFQPNLNDFFAPEADWARLGGILSRNVEGSDQILRAPNWGKAAPGPIIKGWHRILEANKRELPQGLLESEWEAEAKIGPLSPRLPFALKKPKVLEYFDNVDPSKRPWSPPSDEALYLTIKDFEAVRGLQIQTLEKTLSEMRLSTFSGTPYSTTRRDVVELTLDQIRNPTRAEAAVLLARGQEGGPRPEDVKDRVVQGFPFQVNWQELRVYQAFIRAVQDTIPDRVPGWVSNLRVDQQMTKLFDSGSSRDPVIATDFTSYDTHFNRGLQDKGLEFYQAMFTHDDEFQKWCDEVYRKAYTLPIICTRNFAIACTPGSEHGMGSGAGATQPVETPVHRIQDHQCALDQHTELNEFSMELGDDGVSKGDDYKVDGIVRSMERMGMEMNPSKQMVSTYKTMFLRRFYHIDHRVDGVMRGIYPSMRALGRIMFVERYRSPKWWGPHMVALRDISIINNMEWHPLREQFVQYVLKGDKYRLGLNIPKFFDKIQDYLEEASAHERDFVGYNNSELSDKQGIYSWWVVQYLMSLKD